MGDYTLKELETWNEKIEGIVNEMGLNYYNQEFEIISYNGMLEAEAYTGMPSRYPHWSYGKAYEKQKTLYGYDLVGLPYEMVINSNPCIAYLMKENTLLLQILTMAHVYGHNDFFKNNRLFREGTDASETVNMFKNDADTIRNYIDNPAIGNEKVEKILDAAHAIRYQTHRVIGEKRLSYEEIRNKIIQDYNSSYKPRSIIEPYEKPVEPDLSKIPLEPEDDIIYFIENYGNLQEWERNVIEIVRRETAYFIPQIETKIMNEGWASFWHYTILNELKLPDGLHLEFLKRHNDVLSPILGSLNPYYLGFKILKDIEDRYGRDKIFEVREIERDESFIRKYLTRELCEELNLFEFSKRRGEYIIDNVADEEGWKNIRNSICSGCGMNSIPVIRVVELSKKDNNLILEHLYDGRELNMQYAEETLKYVVNLWKGKVTLKTTIEGKEYRIVCDENKKICEVK
ncbi:stage V sporulation protein R [Clostridium acetobutylicum]|nr:MULTISPECIES: SpoVR family protein [Clostridium]ADZ19633.1 Stage V sporulation protein R [Clostridium acetobutylicum EA 2018]MBC2392468.1 SpoVR family protein [Clostridium acetobutylicum]MBC2583762.1 SpoVR family protein [Clostridium acetobutylicum]NOV89386.1 stage V sporulation protein R [Clostridium acetobutylicum]NOW16083.1 stage V sporulation protein R [Clostridium acetobutylicum]